MKKLPLFHRWGEMVRCKAGEVLRSESYVSTSQRRRTSRTPQMAVCRQPRQVLEVRRAYLVPNSGWKRISVALFHMVC